MAKPYVFDWESDIARFSQAVHDYADEPILQQYFAHLAARSAFMLHPELREEA